MITKALVKDIIKGDSGEPIRFKVRIPIFDSVETAREYTMDKDLSNAIACLSPEISNNIQIGDVVFVGFENNDISKPIILGPLYNQNLIHSDITTDIKVRSIKATNLYLSAATDLPVGTNIGEINYQDLLNLVNEYKKNNS